MKKIKIKAEEPGGNVSLLEEHLYEVVRDYLSTQNKECLAKKYKGLPMKIGEAIDNLDSNYVLKISLEEKIDNS